MSTVSRTRVLEEVTNQSVAGWSSVFAGCTQLETEKQSLKFVKKLVTATISNLSYIRSIFPEEAYANKTMNGISLRILKEKSACGKAAQLSGWLLGAFEALEKKYLRSLMLVISVDQSDPNLVHEMYTMKFSYPGGVATCELEGGALAATQRATGDLLRALLSATQNLAPLPEDAFLELKLTYYDEVTPADYEPAGFTASDLGRLRLAGGSQDPVRLGKVATAHHSMQLKVFGPPANIEADASAVRDDYASSESQSQGPQQPGGAPPNGELEASCLLPAVACTCGSFTRDPRMLLCVHCGLEQHAACYKILAQDQLPAEHCCAPCSWLGEGRLCTDPRLARHLDDTVMKNTCIYRRILANLVSRPEVDRDFMCHNLGIEAGVADSALEKLKQDGVVGDNLAVNQEVLQETLLHRYVNMRVT
jgi:hypothetical protein